MNIYNIPFHDSVSEIIKNFIINNSTDSNLPYIIITPNKKTEQYCYDFIKSCESKINNKVIPISISEPKELLKVLLKVTQKSYKKEFVSLLNTSVINKNIRNLLLSNLLKTLDPTLTLKQSIKISNNLATLLDILKSENISSSQLENINITSVFSDNILTYLKLLNPIWNNTLTKLNFEDIITYKAKVLNLISKVISSNGINCKVILLSVDNYFTHNIQLLKSVANYSNGYVIFNGIDYFITEQNWNRITYSHPQYIYKQILQRLNLTRSKVKCFSKIETLTGRKSSNTPRNIDIFSRIFDILPYNLLTNNNTFPLLGALDNSYKPNISHLTYIEASNEDEEAKIITNIILNTLRNNSNKVVTIVTTNIDLSQRIAFYLKSNNILYDHSFGTELTRTAVCKFFALITTIDINNINFINLLALLKSPISKFSNNLYYIELIDLYLARTHNHYCMLSEYTLLLNNLLSNNVITDEEYLNIKNILNSIVNDFQPLSKVINNVTTFSTILNFHIQLAENLSYDCTNSQVKIWQEFSGKTLKEALENIKIETECLSQVTLKEYNNILLNLLKQYNVRNPVSKNTKVYIYGTLQAQYINERSHIIIADFNEKSFPYTPKKEPVCINTILQKLNLTTKSDSIGKEALIFNKLCHFPKVYLTRSIKQQNTISTPSRFLTKLFNTLINNSIELKTVACSTNKYQTNIVTYSNTNKLVEANPPLKYRTKVISATAIEKLLHNPYIYFIEYVLNLERLEDINTKFKASTTGILIHEIFNVFFNKYQNNLKELDETTIYKNILVIANYKFNIYKEKYLNALLSYHIFKYFSKDIASAIYNTIQNNIHFYTEISESIQISNNSFTVKGRADCLALGTNNSTIIDFKTGNINIRKQDILNYKKQLIILAYIFNNRKLLSTTYKVNNLEYWLIPNNLSETFRIISLSKLLDIDLEVFIEKDFVKVKDMLLKYLYTETPFNYNKKDTNNIKEYTHFSRINSTKM